jgi:hypothetical protein
MDNEKNRDEITDTLMERIAKGLSGTFLSTPYPTQEHPTDPDAWSQAVQQQPGYYDEERRAALEGFKGTYSDPGKAWAKKLYDMEQSRQISKRVPRGY